MTHHTHYKGTFISHCSVSPTHSVALAAMNDFNLAQAERGIEVFLQFPEIIPVFKNSFAKLLKTVPENIAFVTSTSHALNFVASGYPFAPGDRIVTYSKEFPSNYYPWVVACKNQGAVLDELPDCDPFGTLPKTNLPKAWSMQDLDRLVTDKTRIVALSHVQFSSGFAADLKQLGAFCKARNVDLVIDAAQSLGAMPLDPEELGISAIAASGWKYLIGPHGASVFYTSAEFREKLKYTAGSWWMMRQGEDYLNHAWDPYSDARRFEFTPSPASLVHGLGQLVKQIFVPEGIENIQRQVFALQDQMLSLLDRSKFTPLIFPAEHRSALLAVLTKRPVAEVVAESKKLGLILTERCGHLRLAPHFYNSSSEVTDAIKLLNSVG